MTRRTPLARLDLGRDQLVVSIDDHGNVDLRLWTDTAGVRLASKAGITFPCERLGDLIAALKAARRKEAA
jgi:hypothetical protein